MKIGVVTFCNSLDNYGQLLQAWALQSALKSLGHDPYVIRIAPDDPVDAQPISLKERLRKYLADPMDYLRYFIGTKNTRRLRQKYAVPNDPAARDFEGFIRSHITVTPPIKTDELTTTPPEADAYICGSDQIWGGQIEYMLTFAPPGKPRIAYAPSFGGISGFPPEREAAIAKALAKFAAVSVREPEGVELCRRLGRKDATLMPDPTFLPELHEIQALADHSLCPTEPYMFVYLLGNTTQCTIHQIAALGRQRNLKMVYVASQDRYDPYPKETATIPQWLGLIEKASLVVTNSFHGTVFALRFNTPFVTLPLSKAFTRMNGRITQLLTATNTLSRLHTTTLKAAATAPLPDSTHTLATLRTQGLTYLTDTLNSCY